MYTCVFMNSQLSFEKPVLFRSKEVIIRKSNDFLNQYIHYFRVTQKRYTSTFYITLTLLNIFRVKIFVENL